MSDPDWLSEEEEDRPLEVSKTSSAPPSRLPAQSPSIALTEGNEADDEGSPGWLNDDPDSPSKPGGGKGQKKARGGVVVSLDEELVEAQGRSGAPKAAPKAFLERMAGFERHRRQDGDGAAEDGDDGGKKKKSAAAGGQQPRGSPRSRPAKRGTKAQRGFDGPTPPRDGNPSVSPRRAGAPYGSPIGENVGLSEASRTQPVDMNDFKALTDEERVTYATEISAFGHDTVARSRASHFRLRLSTIETVKNVFDELYTVGPLPALESTFAFLARMVADSVPSVIIAACETFEFVLSQALFITEACLDLMAPLLNALCTQTKDSRSKVSAAVSHALRAAASHDSIGPVPIAEALCTMDVSSAGKGATAAAADEDATVAKLSATMREASLAASGTVAAAAQPDQLSPEFRERVSTLGSNWKALGARLDVGYSLIRDFIPVVAACEQSLMALGIAGLNCANSRVRRTAVVFVTELYRTLRKAVDPYLLAVRAQNTLKLLREEIDIEIVDDGTDAAGGAATDAQRQEAEDLAALQAEEAQPSEAQQAQLHFWAEALPWCRSVPCIFSTSWRLRQRALQRLRTTPELQLAPEDADTESPPGNQDVDLDRAAVGLSQVVEVTLPQYVPAVASASASLVGGALRSTHWSAEQKRTFALPLVAPLLKFATNDKVNDAEDTCLDLLATLAATNPATLAGAVVRAAATVEGNATVMKTAGKLLIPRLNCVARLLDEHGATQSSSLDTDVAMKFAVDALRHPQAKVRRCAVDLVLAAYKAAGVVVREHLTALDGPILEEVKERIAALAKKDRSRTAPSKRLATIVGGGINSNTTDASPGSDRPSTEGASPPRAPGAPAFAQSKGLSLRQRMHEWREAQKQDPSLCDAPSPLGKPTASKSETGASPSGVPPPAPPNSAPAPKQVMGPSGVLQTSGSAQRRGKLVFA